MKMSAQGLDLLIQREGLRPDAYLDTKGIPTIGVGHCGPEVHMGLHWSVETCRAVFADDVARFERAVERAVKVPLEQFEFDALVSFSHNCGEFALAMGDHGGPCSILRALNAGDHPGAAVAFNNWMADPEDRTRRAAEREQFKGDAFVARFG